MNMKSSQLESVSIQKTCFDWMGMPSWWFKRPPSSTGLHQHFFWPEDKIHVVINNHLTLNHELHRLRRFPRHDGCYSSSFWLRQLCRKPWPRRMLWMFILTVNKLTNQVNISAEAACWQKKIWIPKKKYENQYNIFFLIFAICLLYMYFNILTTRQMFIVS